MLMQSNGNVGIGTVVPLIPEIKLEVNGSVSIWGENGNRSLFFGREQQQSLQSPAKDYGEWGIQYLSGGPNGTGTGTGGLNFWKPAGSTGSQIGNGFGNYFLFLSDNGNVGVGCHNPSYRLDVDGTVRAKEFRVKLITGCDFVFDKNYLLPEMKQRKKQVLTQGYMLHIESAKGKDEFSLNNLVQGLWQNTEEHELYFYQFDERMEKLEKENTQLKTELQLLKKEMDELKKK